MTVIRNFALVTTAMWLAVTAHALDPDTDILVYEYSYPADGIKMPYEMYDIVEDAEGFLWIATTRGLARYDGHDLTYYRVSRYPELLSNKPTLLFRDSRERMYVASARGVAVYDGRDFRTVLTGSKSTARVHAIAEDGDGDIWLGSDEGIVLWDGNAIQPFAIDGAVDRVHALHWQDGRMYAGGRGRVVAIGNTSVDVIELPAALAGHDVGYLEFHDGALWGSTPGGLFSIVGDRAVAFTDEALAGLRFDVLLSDRDGNLWFGTDSMIGRIRPDGSVEIPESGAEAMGFAPEFSSIIEDSQGQIWTTSRFFGLGGMRDTPVGRLSYYEGLDSTNVTATTASGDQRLVVATDAGVSFVDGKTVTPIVSGEFEGDSAILSMAWDERRRLLWLGTASVLRAWDLDAGDWASPSGGDIGSAVNAIAVDGSGRVWAGTDDGLFQFADDALVPVLKTGGVAVESLLPAAGDELWLGTENGIRRIADGVVVDVETGQADTFGSVVAIEELPGDRVVAVSADNGLLIGDGVRWSAIGEDGGVPPEQLMALETFGDTLWLVTSSGIFRTRVAESAPVPAQLDFEPLATYELYRGGASAGCCRGRNDASAKLLDGRIFAATDDGIVFIAADAPVAATAPPVPYLRRAVYAGTAHALGEGGGFTLDESTSNLRIDYSAVQLFRDEQVEFRHRLVGLDDDWIDAGRVREVRYQGLPPGDYRFELQASFNPGAWSETVTTTFTREPAITETAWFRAALWLGTIVVAVTLLWLRMTQTRTRHRRLEKEIRERTGALRALNAELKASNAELEQVNQTDSLTGLVNRRYLDHGLRTGELGASIAPEGLLIIIDIDYFKRINDAYGHIAGDDVLCQFAEVLRSATRQTDLVARWGGEEFILICNCPGNDPVALLDRIAGEIRDHRFQVGHRRDLEVTCSIGAVGYPLAGDDSIDARMPVLIELADASLYAVKSGGRDGWALLTPEDGADFDAIDLSVRRSGRQLHRLVEDGYFGWTTSREGITLALKDTHTRLRAINFAS